MSKKRFKGGLDSLLKSTISNENNPLSKTIGIGNNSLSKPKRKPSTQKSKKQNIEKQKETKPAPEKREKDELYIKMELYKQELLLWRTGKLTLEKFHKSLQEKQLKFNEKTNQIEKSLEN